MDYVIKIMAPAERNYCYTDSQQLDKQTGCIGHLRGDMDKSGNGFFTSWWDHCPELKTQAFKDEFDDFINALRFDDRYGGIFKNRSSLSRYCYEHKESVFAEDFIPQYGFRVDTPEHAYLLRLSPMQGDYNLYVYCYRREALDRHLKNAERGICFVDPQGKTLFRIPDGDSIRVLRPDGTQHDHICRYIDDHRAEIGSGHLYGMVQFAQQMEQTGSTFVPLRSSLPKQCYSLLLGTGNVVILKRGETGYYKTDIPHTSKEEARAIVEEYNRKLGVTRAQEEAMKGGSMFGFDTATAAIPWWTNPSLFCPSLSSWTGAASALCKRASLTGAWMPCMRPISGVDRSRRCAFCGRSCWSSRRRKPVIWRWRWNCSPLAVWMPLPMKPM